MTAKDIEKWIWDAAKRPGGRENLLQSELAQYLLGKFEATLKERQREAVEMAAKHRLYGGTLHGWDRCRLDGDYFSTEADWIAHVLTALQEGKP